MSLMVSVSGVRGVVGESLTPEVVVKYAAAFGQYCNGGKIVVGRDGRITGKIIGNIVSSTLLAMGCDVVALGIVPTPTIQIAVEQLHAAGGISITASHNPLAWNGLKFIASSGMFLNVQENKRLWSIADSRSYRFATWDEIGNHTSDDSFLRQHDDMVLNLPLLEKEKIMSRKLKIVVDCINCAGGLIVPMLLRRLGCDVTEMNCDVSGVFTHTPEPVPENLSELCQRVKDEHADLGIAVDPDVDRLVLITEQGEPLGEEYTITSVVDFVLKHRLQISKLSQAVVVNLSTTRAVDDVAARYNATVFRTPVGEINVAQRMREVGAIVGGEGSGGVILPAVHYGRDAIVGIGIILQYLAEFGGTLSELKSTLPQYAIVKSKVEIGGKKPDIVFQHIQAHNAVRGTVNEQDGLKIDFTDSWVHLRTSNTEPIIRIIAEARTSEKAQQLVDQFKEQIENV
jgi:phosphomannomutase